MLFNLTRTAYGVIGGLRLAHSGWLVGLDSVTWRRNLGVGRSLDLGHGWL
jgi:hypothetical protein